MLLPSAATDTVPVVSDSTGLHLHNFLYITLIVHLQMIDYFYCKIVSRHRANLYSHYLKMILHVLV